MEALNQRELGTYMVLADFSDCANNALKYTISLAKVLPIHIHLFHVIEALEVDEYQLDLDEIVVPKADVAMRKMEAIADIISTEGISVSYELSYGKLNQEIDSHLEKLQPDVFVLPKSKLKEKKSGKLLRYLMTDYSGSFMIIDQKSTFSKETKTAIAYKPLNLLQYNWNVPLELNKHSNHKLSLLHTSKTKTTQPSLLSSWIELSNNETEYEFNTSINSSVSNGLIEAIKLNNIGFISVGKSLKKPFFLNPFLHPKTIASNVIQKLEIPVLVLGKM